MVEDTALHAYHNPLQIMAQMVDEVSRWGKGKRWTLLQTFQSADLMASFCEEQSYSKGRKTVSSNSCNFNSIFLVPYYILKSKIQDYGVISFK